MHVAADVHERAARGVDGSHRTGQGSGVTVGVYMCPGAAHGKVIDTCPTEWGQWIVGFLDRVFQMPT